MLAEASRLIPRTLAAFQELSTVVKTLLEWFLCFVLTNYSTFRTWSLKATKNANWHETLFTLFRVINQANINERKIISLWTQDHLNEGRCFCHTSSIDSRNSTNFDESRTLTPRFHCQRIIWINILDDFRNCFSSECHHIDLKYHLYAHQIVETTPSYNTRNASIGLREGILLGGGKVLPWK